MTIPHHIHMVGIGGIGLSALAQLLAARGHVVSGSDRDESPTTELLRKHSIEVSIGHGTFGTDVELLVYSDAVPPENTERVQAHEMGIPQKSYFELLGEVSESMRTVAISGTHGKTTTTGMVAAILKAAQKHPTAIVGSIVRDFESNFLPGNDEVFVIEACEYRDHMLELTPEILVITNLELDHTDFFPSLTALQNSFRAAVEKVPAHGAIITDLSDPNIAPVLTHAKARIVDYTKESVPELLLIGEFNRANARAAKAAARAACPDISEEVADEALKVFRGSWRRFEFKGTTVNGAEVYDDYAHHPTAMEKTIAGARERFPGKTIVVAFHPHLYSRTKSFLNEYAEALAKADRAIVAPIYAAREVDDGTISNHVLADLARAKGGEVMALDSFDAIRAALETEGEGTVIITMGAGDIYKVAETITM